MKLYIVAIAAILSVAHAVEIRGTCFMVYKTVSNENPYMRCSMTIDNADFHQIEGTFTDRPRFPKVCDSVMCVERDSTDPLWTSVYYNGQKISYMDGNPQVWQEGSVEFEFAKFVGIF
ncbi:hypothetical protein FBU30_006954 [Linnemannia zychae]|nr:hypothetical protein FBU30_006954 [Linnemannia zychae]